MCFELLVEPQLQLIIDEKEVLADDSRLISQGTIQQARSGKKGTPRGFDLRVHYNLIAYYGNNAYKEARKEGKKDKIFISISKDSTDG